ncbi:hypothetical protein CIHG_03485 [Coccidioides immitis H538.4]|uniref:Uncharacterized protein n=1 Tax=Coccidioides immitis H538.4 TaxID=396776 RepID=A0A0J8RMY2_COCIT|nr:hypothetical protein CIHG_03485 [Coccidioides immitis H538.4]
MPVRVLTESPGQFYTTTTGKAWDEVGTANNHRYGYFSPPGTTIGLTMVDVAISGEIAAPSRRLLLSDEVGERRMGKRSDQPMCEEHGTGSGRTEMKVALKARDKIKRRSRERERETRSWLVWLVGVWLRRVLASWAGVRPCSECGSPHALEVFRACTPYVPLKQNEDGLQIKRRELTICPLTAMLPSTRWWFSVELPRVRPYP